MLLAHTREATCATIKVCVEVATSLGLTVSFPKVKFMVVSPWISGSPLLVVMG